MIIPLFIPCDKTAFSKYIYCILTTNTFIIDIIKPTQALLHSGSYMLRLLYFMFVRNVFIY